MASEVIKTKATRDGTTFKNPWIQWPAHSFDIAYKMSKFFFSLLTYQSDHANLENLLPVMKPYFLNQNDTRIQDGNCIRATWIGHASVLVEIDGFRVLCDPIFSSRCPPPFGPKRFRDPPCEVEDLPSIDAVVISHNHYDHMDYTTIHRLSKKYPAIEWLIPMNDSNNLMNMLHTSSSNVTEMMWWDKKELTKIGKDNSKQNLTIYFTPAQHWSKRGLFDSFKSLWGSWTLIGPKHRFWFGGDTGYCPAFKEIGESFGPFDGAAIPIGAYEPREIMTLQHVNPDEAVQIHKDIKSKRSFGIHWGTFQLTLEHFMDPQKRLNEIIRNEVERVDFFTIKHGETVEIIDDTFKVISGNGRLNSAEEEKLVLLSESEGLQGDD